MSKVLKSTRAFGSPGRYIQGPGELNNIKAHSSKFGNRVFAVIDQFFFDNMTKTLNEAFADDGEVKTYKYYKEVTEEEIKATTIIAEDFGANVVIGIGGGKTLDTAKAVADNLSCPVIVVPTTASTDAPTSSLSIMYKENGEHSHARNNKYSPDLVLIDSSIIANAPVRFLVSGMGDALATIFEAEANDNSDSPNYINEGYRRTKTSLAIARACYETLLEKGFQAKISCENKIVTEPLEDIIEVNTLMSGLGFENTGCAGAHSIGDGITALPCGSKTLHGEKVAFGVICQLVAENAPMELIDEVARFCLSVGLPITLEDLYVEKTPENLRIMAECSMNSFWDSEPFYMSVDDAISVYIQGDAMGYYFKEKYIVV